jgi:hypothetical protein
MCFFIVRCVDFLSKSSALLRGKKIKKWKEKPIDQQFTYIPQAKRLSQNIFMANSCTPINVIPSLVEYHGKSNITLFNILLYFEYFISKHKIFKKV